MEDDGNIAVILKRLIPNLHLPENLDDESAWNLIAEILSEPEKRQKLSLYNTINDAVELIRNKRKILVLTGAGISVSCGIPDFRSKDGIYARLHKDFPDLPNPQAMFDINYFRSNPRPFFDFAREIFPGQFKPSFSHTFIKKLEDQGQLLRNYTQNIDTLEQAAGIHRVVQCHGSFASATCCNCKHQVDCDFIRSDIQQKKIPYCPVCPEEAEFKVLKPDIVFFGEDLPKEFHDQISSDKMEADLIIVIGSSMKVKPVAFIPNTVPNDIPQILINREPLTHINFDIELLGNCDVIIRELCLRLGLPFNELCEPSLLPMKEITELNFPSDSSEETCATKKMRMSNEFLPPKEAASAENCQQPQVGNNISPVALRKLFKPRLQKISSLLPDNSFYFEFPNRYVFEGGEVYRDLQENNDSSTTSDDDSQTSSSDEDRSRGRGAVLSSKRKLVTPGAVNKNR